MVFMSELEPIALCMITQDLLDTKRFRENFCDNLLLRGKEGDLKSTIFSLKRRLNLPTKNNFLPGFKSVILNNIDKILYLVPVRYGMIDYKAVEEIVREGKKIIQEVIAAGSFEELAELESKFKSKITLPTYQLFSVKMKRRGYE